MLALTPGLWVEANRKSRVASLVRGKLPRGVCVCGEIGIFGNGGAYPGPVVDHSLVNCMEGWGGGEPIRCVSAYVRQYHNLVKTSNGE